jgi:hypothetical protein
VAPLQEPVDADTTSIFEIEYDWNDVDGTDWSLEEADPSIFLQDSDGVQCEWDESEEGCEPSGETVRGQYWSSLEDCVADGLSESDEGVADVDSIPMVFDESDENLWSTGKLPVVKGDGVFYPSASGLTERGRTLYHLFEEPVEVLANYPTFTYENGVIRSTGQPMMSIAFTYEPQVTGCMRLAQQADAIAARYAKLDLSEKRRAKYYRSLRILDFMRCVADVVFLAWQEVRLRTDLAPAKGTQRALRRLKDKIVLEPYATALGVKQAAAEARAWFFGGPRPTCPLSSIIPPTKRAAMIFSYAARALPSPSRTQEILGIQALQDRLCGGDKVADTFPHFDYEEYVRRYLTAHQPKELSLWSMPSPSASLGYRRADGGQQQAIQDLTVLGYALTNFLRGSAGGAKPPNPISADCLERVWSVADDFNLDKLSYRLINSGREFARDLPPVKTDLFVDASLASEKDLESLLTQSSNSEYWRQCLTLGVIFVMENVDLIPVLPIAAGEKGLKMRFPTLTLAAANLVYQILRRALEQHMVLDQRCSAGLGGSKKAKLGTDGPWYSQDATFATDLHTFELTRVPYEVLVELHPELRKYKRWFDKLFGPKAFITTEPKDVPLAPHAPINPAKPVWAMPGGTPVGPGLPEFEALARGQNTTWFGNSRNVGVAPGAARPVWRHNQRGGAELPRFFNDLQWKLNKYVKDFAKWLVEIKSLKYVLTTNGGMMGDATSFPIMTLQSGYAAEKAGFPSDLGELVGDDSLLPEAYDFRVELYERHFLSLGGQLSKSKTFVHEHHGLITEQPVIRGKRQPYTLLSMWSAPPGGSKGQVTPYSQVTTLVDHHKRLGKSARRAIWSKSPFRQWHRYLAAQGLPLGAPGGLGGLEHPGYAKKSIHYSMNQRWLTRISQLRLVELYTGTGLNPVRATATSLLRDVGKQGLEDLVRMDRENRRITERSSEIRRGNFMPDKWLDPTFALAGTAPILLDADAALLTHKPRQLIAVDQLVDHILGPVQSWEFYFRPTIRAKAPRPTVMSVVKNFRHQISKARRIRGRAYLETAATLKDVERKLRTVAVRSEVARPKSLAKRSFGLEPNQGPRSSRDSLDKQYLTATGDLLGRPLPPTLPRVGEDEPAGIDG